MEEGVGLSIKLDIAGALKSLNKFAQDGNKSISSVEKSLKSLDRIAKAALGFFAGREIIRGFREITKYAAENEEALTKMEVALKLAGEYSEEAARGFEKFADQLQATSVYSGDAVLSSIALAKQFGLTNEQAKRLVSAAADLAAVTGESLESAVSNLGKTLDGTAGRLTEQIPALRNMSAAQLQAGAAIDYVAKRFQGAALAAGGTYAGSIIKAKNSFEDLLKLLGLYVTRNVYVLAAINEATKLFLDLGAVLKANESTLQSIVKSGILGLINGLGILTQAIELLDKAFSKIYFAIAAFSKLLLSIPSMISALSHSIAGLDLAPLKKLNEELNKATQEREAPLQERLKIYDALTEAVAKYSLEVEKSADKQVVAAKKASDALKNQVKIIEQLNAAQRAQFVGAVSQNPFGALFKDANGEDQIASPNPRANTDIERGLGVAGGAILAVSKGAEGATKAAAGLIGAISNTLLPGIGGLVGQVFEILAQGPEKVQEFIRGFAQAIPEIVVNVAKAIPVLIEELIRQLPVVIQAIVDSLPEIIENFILGIPKIIQALVESAPRIISTLVTMSPQIITQLVKDAPRIITELVKSVPKIVETFATEFLKIPGQFLEKLFGGILGIGGGGGGPLGVVGSVIGGVVSGVGSVIGSIGDIFGFKGSSDPIGIQNPRLLEAIGNFMNSTFNPTVQPSTSLGFNHLWTGQRSVSDGTIETDRVAVIKLQLGEKELASTILRLNRNGFRVT